MRCTFADHKPTLYTFIDIQVARETVLCECVCVANNVIMPAPFYVEDIYNRWLKHHNTTCVHTYIHTL